MAFLMPLGTSCRADDDKVMMRLAVSPPVIKNKYLRWRKWFSRCLKSGEILRQRFSWSRYVVMLTAAVLERRAGKRYGEVLPEDRL